jgi:hypothetical protein
MSTKDQLLYSDLHGTAMRYAAERRNLAESIAELREMADGRDHVLAEAAGITAGTWYAWPSTHVRHELVAAGMLIMAAGHDGKPMDYDELERWTRIGYELGPVLTLSAGPSSSWRRLGGGHCRRTDASNPNPGLPMPRLP